jgi:hypothetical protein
MGLPLLRPIRAERAPVPAPEAPAAGLETAARVVADIGFLLAVVGLADLLLVWFPLAVGNPEWEFGTVSAFLDGLPAASLGLGLVLASALVLRQRWVVRVTAVLFALLALLILGAAVLYATNIPLALRSVTDPTYQLGMYKAVVKTLVQALCYPAAFLWIAAHGWRYGKVPSPLGI